MKNYKNNFFRGVVFSYLYIAVYLITGILTTPLLLNHFQADYFALLMLIYTIITYLNNIRLGLPESLAAIVAKNNNKLENILTIKKSFFILVSIVILFFILFYFAGFIIEDWRIVLGDVYSLEKDKVLNVFFILVIFAVLRIPLDMALSVYIGFHDVYLEKVYRLLNPLINFILILFVVYTGKSILFFAFLAGLFDFLVSFISFVHAVKRYRLIKIKVKQNIDCTRSFELIKQGSLFFQLSLTQNIIWGVGIFFVSHMLTLYDVTVYSLTMKIYIYIFYAFIIINSVLAPLYGKHYANNNWNEIKLFFNISILFLPFLGGFIWITSLYFMDSIIFLWTGSNKFYIGDFYVFFMGIFFYFMGYVNSYITLLYSIGQIKKIIAIRWKEVLLNLLITIIFIYFFDLLGVAIGISIALVLTSVKSMPSYISISTGENIKINFDVQIKHFKYILLPNILIAFFLSVYIDDIFIKFVCFSISIYIYSRLSWHILLSKDKDYIISLFDLKKRNVEN